MALIDEVAKLKAQGYTAYQIAEKLGISYWLVKVLCKLVEEKESKET